MRKNEIIQKLQPLELPLEEFWLIAGSAMVMHGIREETRDIDIGCSKKLADMFEKNGYSTKRMQDGSRSFTIGVDIEVFEDWLFDRVEYLDGLPVISVKGLLEMKQALGREKDKADIALIKAFMHRK